MRISFLLLIGLIPVHAARAQNSDFGLLIGGIWSPKGEVASSPGSTYVRGSLTASGQVNYAFQVLQRSVDLYVELPLVIYERELGTVTTGSVTSISGRNLFFTPGVRLKFSPQARVSFYGAIGVGLASFGTNQVDISGGTVKVSNGTDVTAALDFGGGIDFRMTRLLSLRVDARDFVTPAHLGGVVGHNHGVLDIGIAFHF